MSTYRIYEELTQTLGDKAARAVIHAIDNVYEELKSTVSKSDFSELKQIVADLAAAQQRTEKRVEDLAAAQERTEKEVGRLAREMRETRREVGGLSHTVGYQLEDRAYGVLPALLKRDFGIDVEGRLRRGFLPDRKAPGKAVEVNILGDGKRNGEAVRILGEAKAQLSRRKVDQYLDKVVPRIDTGASEPFVVFVAYMETELGVADHARERGAACYFTFEF